MEKLTSQNSSKSKTAKSRNANHKTPAEEKKPKRLSRKKGSSNRKVSPVEAKDKLQPELSQDLHVSVVSRNGHSEFGPKLSPLHSGFDLQGRARRMVKLVREQGYCTSDDIIKRLAKTMACHEAIASSRTR